MIPKSVQKLAKFLSYVLGCRPDEFGLLPDEGGYVRDKELLKSLNEEDGWRHIRLSHLKEVALSVTPSPIEIHDNRIRAVERVKAPRIEPAENLPKLLYLAVRRRAYPAIVEKGMHGGQQKHLVLCADDALARRIGNRRDNQPVLLTIQTTLCVQKGTRFRQYGEHLFLADTLYPGTFRGPALPKEKPPAQAPAQTAAPAKPKTPGSYFPDPSPLRDPKPKRRKEADWKKERRRARRHKARQQE